MSKIAFTTGGTGGHIYPALALAKEMKKQGDEILFIGTSHRMEKEIVPNEGFEFYGLDVIPLKSVKSFPKMMRAIFEAKKILKNNNVEAVIGFGNYISLPTLIAAKMLRLKIYLQEQNILMGTANKWCYRFANKIFLAFKETLQYIPEGKRSKFVVTGNPLREDFYNITREKAREILEIPEDEKVVLVMGGSLGAKVINEAIISSSEEINLKNNFKLYWSSGKDLFDDAYTRIKDLKNVILMPYFDNVPELMAASDLVVCRSGASTISELLQLEKPAIFIPYDFVGQKENAEMLEYVNGAKVYTNENAKDAILDALNLAYQKDTLDFMKSNVAKLSPGNAVQNILRLIKEDM